MKDLLNDTFSRSLLCLFYAMMYNGQPILPAGSQPMGMLTPCVAAGLSGSKSGHSSTPHYIGLRLAAWSLGFKIEAQNIRQLTSFLALPSASVIVSDNQG